MENIDNNIVRYDELMPCKAAFIDAKTPGSHLKDNFSIIGGGVTESKHQKVNITKKHGYCIGGAGQPPRIKNSAHSHHTAEVFMVYKGNWRFYWNNDCKTETVLVPGDIISLPTNMFRGFENIGDEYGMIFSILGHDDAGGGVVWLPSVIEEAKGHGLVLLENGKLVDTTIGEKVPDGMKPMPPLTQKELEGFDTYTVDEMLKFVGSIDKYKACNTKHPNKSPDAISWIDIIGPKDSEEHSFEVKPGDPNGDGFNVLGIKSNGTGETGKYVRKNESEVMLVHEGKFEIYFKTVEGEELRETLSDGDIVSFPKSAVRNVKATGKGFAYFVVEKDYPELPILVN